VAVRAQEDALARFLAHSLERSRLTIAQREGLRRWIDVVKLDRGVMLVISTRRAPAACLGDQYPSQPLSTT
jgi:hypothetical protein